MNDTIFIVAFVLYAVSALVYTFYIFQPKEGVHRIAFFSLIGAFVAHLVYLGW